jgi:hypothetical protein
MTTTAPQVRSVRWFIRRSRARTTTGTFVDVSCVGSARNPQVRASSSVGAVGCRKYYCVPTAYRLPNPARDCFVKHKTSRKARKAAATAMGNRIYLVHV